MKITKKLLALVIALGLLCSMMSFAVSADTSEITVHFSLLGDDAHGENGEHTEYAYWISYEEYTLPVGSTAYDLFKTAMEDYGYTYDDSNGYVSAVEDLAEMTNGPRSGWMFRINGSFTDAMDKVELNDGDRMLFFYTDDYNTIDWSGAPSGVNDVIALIDAIGEVTEQSGAAIDKAANAYNKLSDTDKLLVENYSVLEYAQAEYDAIISQRDVLDTIDTAIEKTADYLTANSSFDVAAIGGDWTVFGLARAGLLDDEHKSKYAANVKKALDKNGSEMLSNSKSTENSRVVLALTAAGFDATDFAGYDLTAPLYDYDYVIKQGVNGAVFALLALESADYANGDEICDKYVDYIVSQQTDNGGYSYDGETIDVDLTAMAVSAIAKHLDSADAALSAVFALAQLEMLQNENGGYEAYGSECSESTAQVIVALSEIYGGNYAADGDDDTDEDVDFADEDVNIDESEYFSGAENDADTAYDDDYDDTDNDKFNLENMLNAMMKFYNADGGFGHDSTEVNMLSTEQCFYALVACKRALEGDNVLYDMSDVELTVYDGENEDEPNEPNEPNESDEPDEPTTNGGNATETASDMSSNSGADNIPTDNPDTGDMGGMGFAFAAITAAAAAIVISKKRLH